MFLTVDNICNDGSNSFNQFDMHDSEYLNGIHLSESLGNKRKLKVVLRNIDQFFGMCNGTRLVIQ